MHVSRGNTFQLEYTKKQNQEQNQKINPFIHPNSQAPPNDQNPTPTDRVDQDGPRGVHRITRRKPIDPVPGDRPVPDPTENLRGRQPDRSRSNINIRMRSPSPNPLLRASLDTNPSIDQPNPANLEKQPSVGAPPTRLVSTTSLPEGLNKHFYHFGGDACAVSKQAPTKFGFQIGVF